MMFHPVVELSHAEQEAAAYNAYLAAVQRDDDPEAIRLWNAYAKIHAERPQAVIERMESDKGLR